MKDKKVPRPTEAELEILQVLWQRGPSPVRVVHEHLNEGRSDDRQVGYTTTLKFMQIMLEKGLLERDTDNRTHIYRAQVGEEEVQQRMLKRFVDTTFRGSAARLVLQALGNNPASSQELEEIKSLIEKMEKQEEDPGHKNEE